MTKVLAKEKSPKEKVRRKSADALQNENDLRGANAIPQDNQNEAPLPQTAKTDLNAGRT